MSLSALRLCTIRVDPSSAEISNHNFARANRKSTGRDSSLLKSTVQPEPGGPAARHDLLPPLTRSSPPYRTYLAPARDAGGILPGTASTPKGAAHTPVDHLIANPKVHCVHQNSQVRQNSRLAAWPQLRMRNRCETGPSIDTTARDSVTYKES